MCGIAGFFGLRDIPDTTVRECMQLMGRRGPDAAGSRRFNGPKGRKALLVHTRLSIIDLEERSNQPFNIGNNWIAFNGALYNYVEIAQRLRADGIQFRTRSDTEVFLAAIERDGWGILDRAEGMWAM